MTVRLLGADAAAFMTGRRLELDLEAGQISTLSGHRLRRAARARAAGGRRRRGRSESRRRRPGSGPLRRRRLAGVRSRFWAMLLRSDRAARWLAAARRGRRPDRGRLGRALVALHVLSGPLEGRALTRADPSLEAMLFSGLWSWLRALSLALLSLFRGLTAIVGHPGVAIIALAICVKILLLPLTVVADRLQEQVNATQARLRPGIDAINAAHRGEERARRTLALYRDAGVHPLYTLKSLLGFLIQIPAFVAVFDMLAEDFDLYRVSFLWIRSVAPGRAAPAARMPAFLRLLPEPAAVPDERRLAGRAAAVPLARPHAAAGSPAAPEPVRHDPAVLPALLHVPRRHGPLLDVDERRPARHPGAAAAPTVTAAAVDWTLAGRRRSRAGDGTRQSSGIWTAAGRASLGPHGLRDIAQVEWKPGDSDGIPLGSVCRVGTPRR